LPGGQVQVKPVTPLADVIDAELGSAMTPAILPNKGESMRKLLSVFAATALVASLSVHAQQSGAANANAYHYKWYDGHGQMQFSDSLTAEAMKYGYDVVNAQGLTIQHVERQLNPEERAAANKLAAEQAAQQHAAQERAKAEFQMLSAYPDEESFKISQQQALDTIDQQIHTTHTNLQIQEKALTDLLTRAADIERAKGPIPKYLADSISQQRNVVTGQRNSLERLQAQRAQTVQVQATELVRYRQLKAAQEQPAQ
jgi:hypothetical protein